MRENKKVEETRSRHQIISDNISHFFKEKGMKQQEFAEKIGINKNDFSKKKNNNGSSFNVDDIFNAAKTLDVTVNDLFYTEQEKKEISVLKENKFDPIMAQKQIDIKLLNPIFKDPWSILVPSIVVSLVVGIIIFFILKDSLAWIFLALIMPAVSIYDFILSFGMKKTYIINYLDDVYYKIKEEENKFFKPCIIIHTLQFIILVFSLVSLFIVFVNNLKDEFFILALPTLITCLICLFTLFLFNDKKLKKEIYQDEIKGYIMKLINTISNFTLNICSIGLLGINFKQMWYFALANIICLVLSMVEFLFTSKKYNQYRLVYEKFGEQERELFPKDYKI